MSKSLKNGLIAVLGLGLLWGGPAEASTYTYEIFVVGPATTTVNPGDTLTIDFKIKNTGSFDLTVQDPLIADPLAGISNNLVGATGLTSFDDALALLSVLPIDQSAPVLAGGEFTALLGTLIIDPSAAPGSSFSLFSTLVPDHFPQGNEPDPLDVTVSLDFTVAQPSTGTLPEPTTLPLVALALAAGFLVPRRSK